MSEQTFLIIVDDEASTFLAEQKGDPADYVCKLLREEQSRQQRGEVGSRAEQEEDEQALKNTPDTSGYPQMTKPFGK